jgi:hypothetical protein
MDAGFIDPTGSGMPPEGRNGTQWYSAVSIRGMRCW